MDNGNILAEGIPSRTALTTAIMRAAHQLLDDPILLHDPLALAILGAEQRAMLAADPFRGNGPLQRSLRGHFVVRNRFVEDEVRRGMVSGLRQYVILGAGLDTFAYRSHLLDEGLRVFEVDHPSTQNWKRDLLEQSRIRVPDGVTFVPLDLQTDDLHGSLVDAGLDPSRPGCFSWMGVTPYLSVEAIKAHLRAIAILPRGSSISFDHRFRSTDPIERAIDEAGSLMVAEMGEPFVSQLDPAQFREELFMMGFGEVEAWLPRDLTERYLHPRKDGLHTVAPIICARV